MRARRPGIWLVGIGLVCGLPRPSHADTLYYTFDSKPSCGVDRLDLCKDPLLKRRYENEQRRKVRNDRQRVAYVTQQRAEEERAAEAERQKVAVAQAQERARQDSLARRFAAADAIAKSKIQSLRTTRSCERPVPGQPYSYAGRSGCW